jgi:phage portal protein BeeE
MNLFSRIFQRKETSSQYNQKSLSGKSQTKNYLSMEDDFSILDISRNTFNDTYLLFAWVNIAVNILTRNIARADFTIKKEGNDIDNGNIYDLFRKPNASLSRYDLWKETAAWWFIEGEAFWWFGSDYSGGIPNEIYVLDPRKVRHESEFTGHNFGLQKKPRRWFYHAGAELIPILSDELVIFRDWNPWNSVRGVNPLVSLAFELEQDYFSNKANSSLLKNNSIP